MWIGIAAYTVFAGIGVYHTLFRPSQDDPDASPPGIPIAAGAMTLGLFSMAIATWPVFGFLTPVIGFVEFMGFIMLTSFIP